MTAELLIRIGAGVLAIAFTIAGVLFLRMSRLSRIMRRHCLLAGTGCLMGAASQVWLIFVKHITVPDRVILNETAWILVTTFGLIIPSWKLLRGAARFVIVSPGVPGTPT